jgi:hypothetical protein
MDIKDFLSPAATLIGVRATDKVGLLQDLVNRLALPLNSPSNLVSAALLKREQLLQVQAAQARNAGTNPEALEGAENIQGQKVLTASAPIAPLGWTMFVELPVEEAYASLYAALQRLAIVLAGASIFAVLAGILLARRMVGPIQALRAGAERIGGGDLAQRIGPTCRDCWTTSAMRSDFALNHGCRERNFLMRRQGAKNRPKNVRTPPETKIRELSGRKSPRKRPIWRRIGNLRFARTGWWSWKGPN